MADDPALDAWRALLGAHAVLTRDLDSTLNERHGLTLTEYDVLHRLAFAPDRRLRLGELAARVLFSRAGLTGLVGRLARAGLVERHRAADDGRGAVALLTPAGRRTFNAARRTQLTFARAAFGPATTDTELDQVTAVLTRAMRTARERDTQPRRQAPAARRGGLRRIGERSR